VFELDNNQVLSVEYFPLIKEVVPF